MLQFSQYPGARERHLKRRFRSPLFEQSMDPGPDDLDDAQRLDHEELMVFYREFRGLVEEAVDLDVNVESDVVLGLKERLERSYEQACGLADDQTDTRSAIRKLLAVIMKAVWAGAGSDLQAHAELEQEDTARAAHFALLEYPLVADLLNPESRIGADELVPTLLGEDAESLAAALQLFDADQLAPLCRDARSLLTRLDERGVRLPDAWQRLRQMEAGLAGVAATGLN